MGILRGAKEFHLGFDFVPKLIGQAEHDHERDTGFESNLVNLVGEACANLADQHKTSIKTEMKRRADAIAAEKKRIRDEAEAKRRRKEKRNALREAFKLRNLSTKIQDEIVGPSSKVEFNPNIRVSDVRDYNPDLPAGFCVLGGFTVELIMAVAGLYEWASSKEMDDFRFTHEGMEKFIHDLILNNDFAEGTLVIKVSKDIKKMALETHGDSFEAATEECISLLKDPENIYSTGFKFFIENEMDLQLNPVGM